MPFSFEDMDAYGKFYTSTTSATKSKRINEDRNRWIEDLAKRKLKFAGHVLRGSSDKLTLLALEGYVE